MISLGLVVLFLASLNALKAHDKDLVYLDAQRRAAFQHCIDQFAKADTCYSNAEFLNCFPQQMQRRSIRWFWDNILFKRETIEFMKAHQHSKTWDKEYEPHYKVCLQRKAIVEGNNPTGEKIAIVPYYSTEATLNQYSYLKDKLSFSKITKMLDFLPQGLKNFLMILRFRIFGGIVNVESWPAKTGSYQHEFQKYFSDLGNLPDCDFLMYTRDQLHQIFIFDFVNFHCPNAGHTQYDGYWELYMKIIIELPAFMQSKDLSNNLESNKLLMADIYIASGQWPGAMDQLREAAENHPWQSKIQKAYWRGAANGRQYGYIDIWTDIPNYFTRMEAVLIGQKNPQQVDAQFHRDVNLDYIKMHRLGLKSSLAPDSTYDQQMKYKYMLSIDGWTASWLRVP